MNVRESGRTGPDCCDVADFMRALDAYHGAVVRFEIYPMFPLAPGNPFLRVRMVAEPGPGPQHALGDADWVSVEGQWPSSSHSTFEGLLYRLCHLLDTKLAQEWWRQRELPF